MAPSNLQVGRSRSGTRSRRRILWACACAMPLVLACNGIVGLSDYKRGECSGGGICSDAGGTDVVTTEGGSDAGDSGPPGKGAAPVSWARWRMPNYAVADAGVAPKLEPGGQGEVNDTITGLVWRNKVEGNVVSLEQALAACRNLAPAGDWRVPKRIELVTLIDYGHEKPFIDTNAFGADFPATRVWSSSEVRPFTGGAEQRYWTVDFNTGGVQPEKGTTAVAVTLCVKAR